MAIGEYYKHPHTTQRTTRVTPYITASFSPLPSPYTHNLTTHHTSPPAN